MINKTMTKFGYPNSVVKEFDYWSVLLRQGQVTLGALILICKEDVSRYSEISFAAFQEYFTIIKEIEDTLLTLFRYDKINYLMLMMVDPNVHFHIIPRYSDSRVFEKISFNDKSWPGPPDLSLNTKIQNNTFMALVKFIKDGWIRR